MENTLLPIFVGKKKKNLFCSPFWNDSWINQEPDNQCQENGQKRHLSSLQEKVKLKNSLSVLSKEDFLVYMLKTNKPALNNFFQPETPNTS